MGMFSFIKSAGRMLGLGHGATQDESHPAPPTPSADAIRGELQGMGFDAPGLDIQVNGDTVTLAGPAADAETRERMILAAGNVAGVAGVQESLAVPSPGPEPRFYTVVKGDTLSAIAQRELGNAGEVSGHLRGQQADADRPEQDLPGPGAPYSVLMPGARGAAIRAAFRQQAAWCRSLGSPLTALVCDLVGTAWIARPPWGGAS